MSDSATSSSTAEETVQPIYLWPKGADLSLVKDAVAAAGLPFKVRPFWFQPGKHSRCIVIGEVGELPVTAEYVRPKSAGACEKAVRWFFGLEELPVVHTALSRMQAIFGEEVRELDGPFENMPGAVSWTWPE